MEKFQKIEKFIESMEVDEVNESAQALLLENDVLGGSGTNVWYCENSGNCSDTSNWIGCSNTGSCN